MERGRILQNRRKAAEAVNDFSQVVRLTPKDPNGWYLRGLSYLDLDEVSAAADDFENARIERAGSEFQGSYRSDCSKNSTIRGINAYNNTKLDAAVEWFTKAATGTTQLCGGMVRGGEMLTMVLSCIKKRLMIYTEAGKLDPKYVSHLVSARTGLLWSGAKRSSSQRL